MRRVITLWVQAPSGKQVLWLGGMLGLWAHRWTIFPSGQKMPGGLGGQRDLPRAMRCSAASQGQRLGQART